MRLAVVLAALLAAPAQAELVVTFDEGAPKDRFTLSHEGGCPLTGAVIIIDLEPAPAGLIFDVTGSGPGVAVFQPFEIVLGQLASPPQVKDGDQAIALTPRLAAGERLAFTIDVDDTVSTRGTIVSDAEIAGATVQVGDVRGVFGADAVARVPLPDCLS
ncbi:MAG: aggregation factor core [Jannaschia sp.]